jgi:hypothetical protein
VPDPIADVVLDHVAVAVERWPDAWPRYAVELGGTWSSGGLNVGFGPAQLRYTNGARIEILQPWHAQDNPFLRRFLDRHGPGPHHLTFKVPDLRAAIDLARQGGFTPVGVDLSHEDWMEAFLHPHQATGIVVQLAQAAHGWESPAPEGFPTARRTPAASLLRVTHAVADLRAGVALFAGLLGGRTRAEGTAPDGSWEYVDLEWAGPLAVRLIAPCGADADPGPAPLRAWLGPRPGRLHHLAFALSAPDAVDSDADAAAGAVPGLLPEDSPARAVAPEDNLGTRLVLVGTPRDM